MITLTYNPRRNKNKDMCDFQIISRRQVELAFYIRAFRRCYNLSQTELAEAVTKQTGTKMLASTVSRIENYRDVPSAATMNGLLRVMGLTVEDLDC